MNAVKVLAVSIQGEAHRKNNKECQDFSIAINSDHKSFERFVGNEPTWERKQQKRFKAPFPQCRIAIVADGHGSDEFIRSDSVSFLF